MPWYKIGVKEDITWRGNPPQMLPEDRPIWFEYLDKWRPEYKAIYYNLAMTTIGSDDIVAPKAIQDMWLYSISKRIDAIGEKEEEIDIIEVCDRASIRALGQTIIYPELYQICTPFGKPFNTKIICKNADPDVAEIAPKYDIDIIELHPKPVSTIVRETGTAH